MNGQVKKYLILLLITIDNFSQADPKVNFGNDPLQYNNVLNKKLQEKIKNHERNSRKQRENEDAPPSFFPNDESRDDTRNLEPAEETVHKQEPLKYVKPLSGTGSDTKKFINKKSRPLQAGDVFTPEEFLEVSIRLLKKVKKPGKGIVTSSENEYQLADKLFERYFMCNAGKRIIGIRGCDIEGLDALQALSLDGEVVDISRSYSESYTEAPSPLFYGFKTNPSIQLYGYRRDDFPNKCHYKVLRKWIEEKPSSENKNKTSVRRTAEKLKKALGKNRKIVINPSRREQVKDINNKRLRIIKKARLARTINHIAAHKKIKSSSNSSQGTDNEVVCRWKYKCIMEFQLHTCRLHPVCSNQTEYITSFIDEEPDEYLRMFREAVGISILDENVEKIIEAHVAKVIGIRPEHDKKIEDLMQYFNKLVRENDELGLYHTTPMSASRRSTGQNHYSNDKQGDRPETPDSSKDNDDQEARRILGLIPNKKQGKQFSKPPNKFVT